MPVRNEEVVLSLDASTGEILEVAPPIVDLFQQNGGKLLGSKPSEIRAFRGAPVEAISSAGAEGYRTEWLPDAGAEWLEAFSQRQVERDREIVLCRVRAARDPDIDRLSREDLLDRFEMLMDGVTDYGIIMLNQDGAVVDWNAGAERLFSYSKEEAVGQPATMIFTPEDQERGAAEAELATAARIGRAADDRWHVRRDGTRFLASGVMNGLRDDEGRVRGFVKIVRDVTEQRKAEALLQEAQRTEAVAVLAGGVAHRFNNLLTSILGHTSLVQDTLPPGGADRESLQQVMEAGQNAADLTRQLLAYAGKGRFVNQRVNLANLVAGMKGLLQSSLPRGVVLELESAQYLPEVEGDGRQLEQVVANLVINAGEAMNDKAGVVKVSIDAVTLGAADVDFLELRDIGPGRYVRCEVADSGVGMGGATLGRIFDPFFTTKFLGRGLGLPAVLGIVRQQKGSMQVTTEVGVGSRFRVFLPACEVNPKLDASA